jgi:TolB-like protein
VAVLGFRNLSAHPQDAWISPALGEIFGFELAASGRLRLIPADNVVRMQQEIGPQGEEDGTARLARIGRNLGTHLVITGSYLVSRETIRLQVMVQDVRTGETIAWARETGTREELLDLATSAVRGILGSLDSLGTGPGAAPPEAAALAANAESLRLWSEAMSRLRVSDAMTAVPLLQKAASIDPDNPFVHDALAVAWSRLGFDARAAGAAGQALALAKGLPDEIRLGLEARAQQMRFAPAEAAKLYAELWRTFADDLEYGLALAAMQRRSDAAEASLATVEALRKLPAPDGEDPRIDLAESEAAWRLGDLARGRDARRGPSGGDGAGLPRLGALAAGAWRRRSGRFPRRRCHLSEDGRPGSRGGRADRRGLHPSSPGADGRGPADLRRGDPDLP